MKKIFSALILILLCSILVQPAFAEEGVEGYIYSTDILAFVNGKPIEGYNIGGRTVIIAEDLGDITKEVIELVEESGFPGMRVFQFGFFGGDTPHKPHNYINNCVAYSGTHDNNTLLGYLWETPIDQKNEIMRYCVCDENQWNEKGCRAIIRTIIIKSLNCSTIILKIDFLSFDKL